MNKMKQVILARKDLKLSKGKLAAQVAHASVESVFKSDKDIVEEWRGDGMPKVVLAVKDSIELKKLLQKARVAKLVTVMIRDAGRTEIEEGTITAGAIGPDDEAKIDAITGGLKLFT